MIVIIWGGLSVNPKSIRIRLEITILGLGARVGIWVMRWEEGLNSSWTSTRIQLGEKGSCIRAKNRAGLKVRASLRQGWISWANASVHDIGVSFAAKEGWCSHSILTPTTNSAMRAFPWYFASYGFRCYTIPDQWSCFLTRCPDCLHMQYSQPPGAQCNLSWGRLHWTYLLINMWTVHCGFWLVCGEACWASLPSSEYRSIFCSNFSLTDTGTKTAGGGGLGGLEQTGQRKEHTSPWVVSHQSHLIVERIKLKERSFVKYSLYIFIIWLKGAIFYFVQYVIKTWDIYFHINKISY